MTTTLKLQSREPASPAVKGGPHPPHQLRSPGLHHVDTDHHQPGVRDDWTGTDTAYRWSRWTHSVMHLAVAPHCYLGVLAASYSNGSSRTLASWPNGGIVHPAGGW